MSQYITSRERIYQWFLDNPGTPIADNHHIFQCAKDKVLDPKKVERMISSLRMCGNLVVAHGLIYPNTGKHKEEIAKEAEKAVKEAEKEAEAEADEVLGKVVGPVEG